MALKAKHNQVEFGVGDRIRITQTLKEGDKTRAVSFEGMVLGIKGRGEGKTFTVRRIGVGQIGIERIFPLGLPSIEKIEVTRRGTRGVRRAKLYYTRKQTRKEIEKIYTRSTRREKSKAAKKTKKATKT